MRYNATTTMTAQKWQEKPYATYDNGKLTHADIIFTYAGDLYGEGRLRYLMAYGADGACNFCGMEHFRGRLGDHTGGFVIQHIGHFQPNGVHTIWLFVPGSGHGGTQEPDGRRRLLRPWARSVSRLVSL